MYSLSLEQFIEFYHKRGRTPNQIQKPKNPLNEKQLESSYKRYLKSIEKENEKQEIDNQKMEEVYNRVDKRDGDCQLISKLNVQDYAQLRLNGRGFSFIIDHAHVFGKGAYPHMKFMEDNIVLLNRYSHSMLDHRKNPITGENISSEEHEKWWIYIIGKDRYKKLKEIAYGKR